MPLRARSVRRTRRPLPTALDPRCWGPTDRFLALAILAVLLAPTVAVIRAISQDWAPNGDDATVALRSAGVLDGHFPLTGMRSTAGNGVDVNLSTHHLGPLQFYLLALPLAATGGAAAGVAIGGALIAAIASVLTVVWARRLGGTLAVAVFTCGLLLAQWALGAEAMFRPLNPYAPLLPTYLALLLLWALARGDHRALAPFVVAVSLLAQANLAFLPLAGVLVLAAVAVSVWPPTDTPRPDRSGRRGRRPGHVTTARAHSRRWAVGLGVLVWLPSLLELFVHRPNNLRQFVRWATSGSGDPIGVLAGIEHLSLLAPVPGGFRRYSPDLLTTGTTVGTALGVLALLVLVAISTGWRVPQGRASSAWPARVALVANVGMLATASRLPEWPAAPYWVITWLPVAAFTWAAFAWRGLAYLESATPRLPHGVAVPVAGGLVVGGLAAALLATQPNWSQTRTMTAVARTSVSEMGPGDERPVRISGFGFVPTLGAAPAIAWEAHRAGWEPHYLSSWPFEEDAEYLWAGSAPQGADELFVIDSTEPEFHDGVPETAREVAAVKLTYRDGTISVYREPGPTNGPSQ
ncbi:hypothetical protein [Janibacter cremeus]|uniref:DUF2079 domain-containing protein n=1 Tax=Janibacter cremeus TaxID=1285192 RepID=A0A852VRN4_9MICO|nr:hypothetical protein [Janibacter cremeus]NYF99592.1 hypothetical protein [Janibacter cremeus]